MNPGAEQVAERALAVTDGEAQVTVHAEQSLFSRFARSVATQATAVETMTAEIACVRDGHVGMAGTTDLSDDGLRSIARAAARAAEALARSGPGAYPGVAAAGEPLTHDGYDEPTAALEPERAGEALRCTFAGADERGLQAYGLWTAGVTEIAVLTSAGLRAVDRVTDAHMRVLCRAPDRRSGFAAVTGRAVDAIDARALTERAAAKVASGNVGELPPGEYPVVMEPEAVGALLDFLGCLAFDGLAHAEGRGALVGRLGERVAAPSVSIADAPGDGRTLPRAFDAEGTPKRRVELLREGVAQAVVHDRRSARLAGAVSTGHALRAGGDPHGAMPTNLVLEGGAAASVEELVAPIERGIYVTRFWYVNPLHPRQTLLTGMTRDGTFLIEDGRIGPRIRDVRFTDSVLRILSAVEALTARQELVAEADFYGPRFAHGQVCPALRADGFRVTGVTTDAA